MSRTRHKAKFAKRFDLGLVHKELWSKRSARGGAWPNTRFFRRLSNGRERAAWRNNKGKCEEVEA